MKRKSPNAKDPDRDVPIKLHGVKPEGYSKSIDSGNGSAAQDASKKRANADVPSRGQHE